jgi:hypothetical protein
MPDDKNKYQGMYCCTVPMDGVRMLTFPDGTKSGVVGLDEILAAVLVEGREVNAATAEEIVERLSTKNYIVPSVKHKYVNLLVDEYGKYVQVMRKANPVSSRVCECEPCNDKEQKKGLLSRFLKGK